MCESVARVWRVPEKKTTLKFYPLCPWCPLCPRKSTINFALSHWHASTRSHSAENVPAKLQPKGKVKQARKAITRPERPKPGQKGQKETNGPFLVMCWISNWYFKFQIFFIYCTSLLLLLLFSSQQYNTLKVWLFTVFIETQQYKGLGKIIL